MTSKFNYGERAGYFKRLTMRKIRHERSRVSSYLRYSSNSPTLKSSWHPLASSLVDAQPPFFVLGHPRSGTTLLREIINRHPNIFIPPENGSIAQMIDSYYAARKDTWETAVDRVLDAFSKGYQIRFWCLSIDDLSAEARNLPHERRSLASLFDLIYRHFGSKNAKGKNMWGDKSTPGYFTYLNNLDYAFPSAKYIHIIRDGRDCSASCVKAGFYSKSHIVAAYAWIDNMYYCRQLGIELGSDRYLAIRYEDLTHDTSIWTKRICEFLGAEYHDCMLNHDAETTSVSRSDYVADLNHHTNVRKPITSSFIGKWKSDIPTEVATRVQAITRTELLRHGYQI